ncbi:MAG: sugar transporter [Bacteroidales bacterium]|nr:sugar transporter [Bacteroidales bacterium]
MAESRTQKSIRNAKVALFFSVLTFALGFFSRKILLDALGADILGLYTTANNLCGFLNLAEMGITSAVAFSLYKPIFDNDRQAITEIVSIQGWLFRYVGTAMIVGAIILMACFPVFFNEEKTHLPLWYSYATFGVVFLSQVLGYFFCYQQTLLSADQKEYKIVTALQGGRSLKMVLQIVGIGFWGLGYEFWLIIELLCGVLTVGIIAFEINKQYKWLNCDISQGGTLLIKYHVILEKIKQMMVHKICFSIIDRVSPVIVYGLISLSVVAIYGNYMMIITNIGILVSSCFNGLTASIGNLASERNDNKVESFFRSCLIFRLWLVSIICYCIGKLINPFMTLWVGADYLFDEQMVLLLVIFSFVEFSCTTDPFIYAYGLYQDIWAPITHLALNLSLSIILGMALGVKGVVLGVTISQALIYGIWKPYFLYTRGFKISALRIIPTALVAFLLIGGTWYVSDNILNMLNLTIITWGELVYSGTVTLLVFGVISTALFYGLLKRYRETLVRILQNATSKR